MGRGREERDWCGFVCYGRRLRRGRKRVGEGNRKVHEHDRFDKDIYRSVDKTRKKTVSC